MTGKQSQTGRKPTKKEISKRKEAARVRRKAAADKRKASKPGAQKENPFSVKVDGNGVYSFRGRSFSTTKDKNAALEPFGKVLFQTGVQLQILPNGEQENMISRTIGCARFVRNDYLDRRIQTFQDDRSTLSVAQYKKDDLKGLKETCPWLKEVDKFALEAAVENVDQAYKNFFDGRGSFPKFVSKYKPAGNKYTTKYTNGNIALSQDPDGAVYLKLPKVGKVRAIMPGGKTLDTLVPFHGRITKVTITRDGQNYTASLATEAIIDKQDPARQVLPDRLVSADMGISRFCTYSNGSGEYERVQNPRWITSHERRLRRLQKALSRKQYDQDTHKGSRNWEKAKLRVSKEQRKIANQRKDFEHKLSRKISDSCDVFICEDLSIRGMMKNRHLAKQVASAGWGQFLTFVKYKLERKGGIFLKVGRFFPSSKLCSCGYKHDDLKQGNRYWICPECHTFHDRDDNAVDNLRAEGIRLLQERGVTVVAA